MARETSIGGGCNELDLLALWPCTAQLGCVPLSEILTEAPIDGVGEGRMDRAADGQPRVESD